jgi:hypothetical protein
MKIATIVCCCLLIAVPLLAGSATATTKTETATYELKLSATNDGEKSGVVRVSAELFENGDLVAAPNVMLKLGEPASAETKGESDHFVLHIKSEEGSSSIRAEAEFTKNGTLVFAPNVVVSILEK